MPGLKKATISMTPLTLLRRIRDVMARAASAQERLDKLVELIAAGFNAEVCSIYLLRAGDILELFANVGLKKSSVHVTKLSVGQGLVGAIALSAEPLNLADASAHPQFEYRPETGEERYSSFTGVPILQGGRTIGVLVVQGKKAKRCTQAQVEVLQTVAMVLSELAASGQLIARGEMKALAGGLIAQQLSGVALSPGMAKAPAVLHQPQLVITRYVAADSEHEKAQLEKAIGALQESFGRYIQASGDKDEEQREILETYLLFTQDRGWRTRIHEAIESGLTAEAAVKKVQEELQAKMSQMASPYIKERIQDLEDLSNHLLQALLGKTVTPKRHDLPPEFILVARTLGPAELLDYDPKRIKGLVLEEGSATSHTSVIARALDIPALAKVEQATTLIQTGDLIIADADAGTVHVRPTYRVEQAAEQQLRHALARAAAYAPLKLLPAITKDGVTISLNVNAGLTVDVASVLQEGIDGIGLYRTELPYMTTTHFPESAVQRELYEKIYRQLPGKRIVFRSFDIGGDKKVPYLQSGEEENPAMGWRAIRIGLDRPGLLRTQCRALIAAAHGRELCIMFPFVAVVAEFIAAKKLLMQEWEAAEVRGQTMPSGLKVGVMIEIPSLLWQLDALLPKLDFVSIGSNDLMQFLFACDRGAAHMAGRYDTLSAVMLSVVRQIVQKAKQHKVEVGFCGEMARRPLEAMALLGVGVRNLSVSASATLPLKGMIRSVTLSELAEYMDYLLARADVSVRQWLLAYAGDHGIAL